MFESNHYGICLNPTITVYVWIQPLRYMFESNFNGICLNPTITVYAWIQLVEITRFKATLQFNTDKSYTIDMLYKCIN